jgi:hypothetical protein
MCFIMSFAKEYLLIDDSEIFIYCFYALSYLMHRSATNNIQVRLHGIELEGDY